MPKVEVKTETFTEMRPVKVEKKVVVITLTEKDAEALACVCAKIGGRGDRLVFSDSKNSILYQLNSNGIKYNPDAATGSIYFPG